MTVHWDPVIAASVAKQENQARPAGNNAAGTAAAEDP